MHRRLVVCLALVSSAVLLAAAPAPAASCGPRGADRVAVTGPIEIRVTQRGDEPLLVACRRGARRAVRFSRGDNAARILAHSRRWIVAASTYRSGPGPDGFAEEDDETWTVRRLDLRTGRATFITDLETTVPSATSYALTRRGDVLWSTRESYEVLRLFRRGRTTDLGAAVAAESRRAAQVRVAGDRVRWKVPGQRERRFGLAARLRRVRTCFPTGGSYLLAGEFGEIRRIGAGTYLCLAAGPARRTKLPGTCPPTSTALLQWNDHLTWACAALGAKHVHVYAMSTRTLLLAERTNLAERDGIELTLSEFGAVAWVDRPAPGGKLTAMKVFAPGLGVRVFDEGGERVMDPSWNGRTVSWTWFRTAGPDSVARSYAVPG